MDDIRKEYHYIIRSTETQRAENKHILVTGATGGIGFALCLRLSIEGATVGVAGRSLKKIEDSIRLLKETVPTAKLIPVELNVLDEVQIKEAIKNFAEKNNGKIDALINNAGGGEREKHNVLWKLPSEVIKEVLDTNLLGSMLCAKYALPYMIPHRSGKIINLSSVMGMNGKETWSAYSSSKSGILGFTKSLALECGEYNICVNSVAPGMVLKDKFDRIEGDKPTDTNTLHRWGYTDEVASLIAFLISDEANYITGQNIAIDGGRSIGLK